MKVINPMVLIAAQVHAPKSLAAYMAAANLRLRAQTVQSVKHEAKLPPAV